MGQDCIFCKIVSGQIPSYKVYEDDFFLAFLDIFPTVKGHTLIIPKEHCINALDTPEHIAEKFYPVVVKIANAVKKAYNADGINIIQNNGAASGQEVFHSHIHIIPRHSDDGLRVSPPVRLQLSSEEFIAEANKIINIIKGC